MLATNSFGSEESLLSYFYKGKLFKVFSLACKTPAWPVGQAVFSAAAANFKQLQGQKTPKADFK